MTGAQTVYQGRRRNSHAAAPVFRHALTAFGTFGSWLSRIKMKFASMPINHACRLVINLIAEDRANMPAEPADNHHFG